MEQVLTTQQRGRLGRVVRSSLLLLLFTFFAGSVTAQTAQVNVIHNSPYAEAALVDVYVNDALALDDVAFRQASGFTALPAGVELTIDITAADAADNSSPVFSAALTLTDGETYVVTAAGDPLNREGNPAFNLFVQDMARAEAGSDGEVDVLVFHGSPDAPVVDVQTPGADTPLVDDLAFGDYRGYLTLPVDDYVLDITPGDDNENVVASFGVPLETLGLGGTALTVLASGFFTPPTEADPGFGLFVALPDGGELVALENITSALVQVIHNAADVNAALVDIYLSNEDGQFAMLDDVAFRVATEYLAVPPGDVRVDIAPSTSSDAGGSIFNKTFTLAPGTAYVVVASGSLDENAPAETQFDLFAGAGALTTGDEGLVSLQVFHGVTDAPAVNALVPADSPVYLASGLAFGEFSGYTTVPEADYPVNVETATGDYDIVARYMANLETLDVGGFALMVLASGYLAPPDGAENRDFGLFAALPIGGELVPLDEVSGVANEDAPGELPDRFAVLGNYPNPFNPSTSIRFDLPQAADVRVDVYDMLGRRVLQLPAQAMGAGTGLSVQVDAAALSSGMYLYRVTAVAAGETLTDVGTMTLLK
jgi:hypothetical protein